MSTKDQGERVMSVRARVTEELRHRIVSLQLPPGTPLSENELAIELKVSRTPIRESLILLREEDLVRIYPQRGTFVSRVSPARVAHAEFVREAIECSALVDVALPLNVADVETIEANLRHQEQADTTGDVDEFFRLDEEFHLSLLRLSGHDSAWRTVQTAKGHLDRARRLSLTDTRPVAERIDEHRSILTHLVEGDSTGAVQALRAHLRAVFDDVERIRERAPELFSDDANERVVRRVTSSLA